MHDPGACQRARARAGQPAAAAAVRRLSRWTTPMSRRRRRSAAPQRLPWASARGVARGTRATAETADDVLCGCAAGPAQELRAFPNVHYLLYSCIIRIMRSLIIYKRSAKKGHARSNILNLMHQYYSCMFFNVGIPTPPVPVRCC